MSFAAVVLVGIANAQENNLSAALPLTKTDTKKEAINEAVSASRFQDNSELQVSRS